MHVASVVHSHTVLATSMHSRLESFGLRKIVALSLHSSCLGMYVL
jgi:hypothetical protein